jgi:Protein of unknown function DUF262
MDLLVGDLVNRFDSGEIQLPIMQRDYVWKPKKVVELLDSLYRGWLAVCTENLIRVDAVMESPNLVE